GSTCERACSVQTGCGSVAERDAVRRTPPGARTHSPPCRKPVLWVGSRAETWRAQGKTHARGCPAHRVPGEENSTLGGGGGVKGAGRLGAPEGRRPPGPA